MYIYIYICIYIYVYVCVGIGPKPALNVYKKFVLESYRNILVSGVCPLGCSMVNPEFFHT